MEVIFLEPARKDVRDAYEWYEARQKGLGNKFVKEVVAFSKKLERKNIEYRKYVANTQYIKLQNFPFQYSFLKKLMDK